MMKGIWKGKSINFVSGKLMASIKSNVNREVALQDIERYGGEIDFISKDFIDIIVGNHHDTLKVASLLEATNNFRFVAPEIL